jgi:uncharacterized repeat protein (TIGR01451 family)
VTAQPAPALTIAMSNAPSTFAQLQSGTYTITATNSGNAATDGSLVTLTDTLPTGLTASSMTGSGWSCTLSSLTCTRSAILAAGSSYPPITLTVNVAVNAPATVTNSANVWGGGEVNTNNGSCSDVTGIGHSTVATMATPTPGSALSGSAVTFTWNQGAAGTQYYLYVGTSGAGSSDILAAAEATATSQIVTGLPVNGATIYVRLSTCAAICSFNDYTYVAFSGTGNPSLSITKSHAGNFTQSQVGATYTITVTNNGAGPTNGSVVTVTDTVPAGLSASNMTGSGWNCPRPAGSCNRSDVLAAGTSYAPITLSVNVASNAPATVTNSVSVSGGGSATNNGSDATVISIITQTFTSNTTWTVPAGVNSLTIQAYGAGGAEAGVISTVTRAVVAHRAGSFKVRLP